MAEGTPGGTIASATASASRKKEAMQRAAHDVWVLLQAHIIASSEDDDLIAGAVNYVGQLQVCYIIYIRTKTVWCYVHRVSFSFDIWTFADLVPVEEVVFTGVQTIGSCEPVLALCVYVRYHIHHRHPAISGLHLHRGTW